ncbi:hypothetical protein ANO11243_067110 [Dothideomycetidae sp. 11243]|nr:hypothetical protein ANO11243_067110 [fungal sp. No.11243]
MSSSRLLGEGSQDDAVARQTIRNRVNQRNFRSRRQDYTRELEKRLRAFEEAQMQATAEMQAAARFVASENALLRDILKTQLHYTDHELDLLITHMRPQSTGLHCGCSSSLSVDDTGTESSQKILGEHSSSVILQPVISQSSPTSGRPEPALETYAQPETLAPRNCRASPGEPLSAQQDCSFSATRSVSQESTLPDPSPASCAVCTYPSSTLSPRRQHSAGSSVSNQGSISCEEAASILAGVRLSHIDYIRTELGCAANTPCELKHQELMQMLNDSF